MKEHKHEFIKTFASAAQYRSRYEYFSDFIACSVATLHNRFVFDKDLEENYLRIEKRYKYEDMNSMAKLLAQVVLACSHDYCDFLGEVFMELDLGNQGRGQVFTPYCISQLLVMASIKGIDVKLANAPFVSLLEPSCGSGGMAIAFAERMAALGFDPKNQLWVRCIDIDERCAFMAYIQLALLGIPGEVIIGNTLTLEVRKVLRTPEHYLGNWREKLIQGRVDISSSPTMSTVLLNQMDLFVV